MVFDLFIMVSIVRSSRTIVATASLGGQLHSDIPTSNSIDIMSRIGVGMGVCVNGCLLEHRSRL